MYGADEFGPEFQRTLVRACFADMGLRSLVSRFVTSGQLSFSDPTARWAWRVASEDMPTLLQVRTEAARLAPTDPALIGLTALLEAPDARDLDYVRREVVRWAQLQVFARAFEDARDLFNRRDPAGAKAAFDKRVQESGQIELSSADRGWYFEELDQRQLDRQNSVDDREVFPSGIRTLDQAMGGGLRVGDLEVTMAYSGIGKTFWLVHRGFLATRARRRVLHFVLEGGRRKTELRYDAAWADEESRAIRTEGMTGEGLARLRGQFQLLRQCLVIRGIGDKEAWQITYQDVLAEIDELRTAHGWVPELVIVDYGDILHAPGESEVDRQREAFKQLRALCDRQSFRGHRGYAVATATQAVRPNAGADEKEHVLRPRDIADAYAKVKPADVVLSINRTANEKAANQARVYLGKYRDDIDGVTVRVQTDYARGRFCRLDVELDDHGGVLPAPSSFHEAD